jgi:Rrf2 family protein
MRLTLTKQAEYALRILVWLADIEPLSGHAAGAVGLGGAATRRYKAAEIAAATGTPPIFATRVLALLQRHGLLLARAGQQGGYTLGRAAEQINLLEVIEAVEGPLVSRECVLRDGLCGSASGEDHCLLHDAWSAARESLRDILARTTLTGAVRQPATTQVPLAALGISLERRLTAATSGQLASN